MSRTIRRNESHLIRYECGTLEEALREDQWYLYHHPELTRRQAYDRHVAHFTSDCYYGMGGRTSAPRWYLDTQFTRPHRRATRRELDRCLAMNNWDDHLTPLYVRGQDQHWW